MIDTGEKMIKSTVLAACAAGMLASVCLAGEAPAQRPAEGSPLDTRVTVRVKGVPIANFLDTISGQAKVNFIITEGLENKQITAFLQNVTVREALQILLEMKGMTYQQIGNTNTYVVTPRSRAVDPVVTRIYSLRQVHLSSSGDEHAPIVLAVQSVLSKSGRAVADPRTDKIVVTDFPESFPHVEQVIAELDVPAAK